MANLTHLFHEEQKVMCNTEIGLLWGTVKEVYEDHIIVDIPEISDHMWYEEGWNLDEVYPEYNFEDRDHDDKYEQQYVTKYDVYTQSELL
jgi:hypothetical protein